MVLCGGLAFRSDGEALAEGVIADRAAILGHETDEKGREVVEGSSSGYCSSMRNPEDTSFAGASSMREWESSSSAATTYAVELSRLL